MGRLNDLAALGQAIWLDTVDRKFLAEGGLQKLSRRGRADRRHLQPVDLREGDGPRHRL